MERRRSHRKDKIKATNETSGKSIHQIQHYARTDETKKKKKKISTPSPYQPGRGNSRKWEETYPEPEGCAETR